MSEVQLLNQDAFVFIDETGCSAKDHTRQFGYALRGENAVHHRWLHRGIRVSAITAMSSIGMVAVELMTGSVNGDVFYEVPSFRKCCPLMEVTHDQLLSWITAQYTMSKK